MAMTMRDLTSKPGKADFRQVWTKNVNGDFLLMTETALAMRPDPRHLQRVKPCFGRKTMLNCRPLTCLGRASLAVLFAAVFTIAMLAVCGAATVPYSSTLDRNSYQTNGEVYAIVNDGSTTYIGGSFTQVGPYSGSGVPVSASTGVAAASYPKVNGNVNAVASDGTGGWYIGGSFTTVGTLARNYLAHIFYDGTVDLSWNPNANGAVNDLAVSDGIIYAGGSFTAIGGQTRMYLAAIQSSGAVTPWNPGANSGVTVLAVSGGTVYVGGYFTTIGGQTRKYLAAIGILGKRHPMEP